MFRAGPLLWADLARRVRLDHRRGNGIVHRPSQRDDQQPDGLGRHGRDRGRWVPARRPGPRGRPTGECGNAEVRRKHQGDAGDSLSSDPGAPPVCAGRMAVARPTGQRVGALRIGRFSEPLRNSSSQATRAGAARSGPFHNTKRTQHRLGHHTPATTRRSPPLLETPCSPIRGRTS
jgi:hypothetical protein